jgi:two-component system chemotaxis response regulator CheB
LSPEAAPTRVLICEDSRTYAAALRRTLELDGDIVVAGVSGSAEEALEALAHLEPDLVTMDVELPGMSGLEAVEQIMASRPIPILVLSSHVGANSEVAAAALAAGALDAVGKDYLDLGNPGGAAGAALRQRVKLLARARVIRHPRARLRRPPLEPSADGAARATAIGIVASTGGPQALATILRALPATFDVPVLVVQHITAGFAEGLAQWLNSTVPLPVAIAAAGADARHGVWIAAEGHHLELAADGTLALDARSGPSLHRPSGDILLASLAEVAGPHAVAVVLSGMGSDGAAGARAVREARGLVLAQDEESSAVFGMPKAAAEQGGAVLLAPEQIAARLAAMKAAAS